MARSVEEDVEEYYKKQLDECGVEHYAKTDAPNESIRKALDSAPSKRGGQGRNYPDIQCLVELPGRRFLPVMIEAKGARGKLVKTASDGGGGIELAEPYEKDGPISKKTGQPSHRKGDLNWAAVTGWAVNGAVWYADAILDGTDYTECLAIGVNGWEEHGQLYTELSAWYVSAKNNKVPKKLEDVSDLSFLKEDNLPRLAETLDKLLLSQEERDGLARQAEETLEKRVKDIHQRLYDSDDLKTVLSTNEKLYLFCGLIMAGLPIKGLAPLRPEDLHGNESDTRNDGTLLLDQIREFLLSKGHKERVDRIAGLLKPVFERRELWKAPNGESLLKNLYKQVSKEIIPCFKPGIRLDFTGRILNSLNDWVQIENDKANDVVLTPRTVTRLMTRLAQVDRNSLVWDAAAGSGGFLVSALDAMERDAEAHISDADELAAKKDNIHKHQLLGVEILGNIYILAVLNMILMGDGSSRILNANTFVTDTRDFPATVFLLNPPYSHPGKGLDFVARAVEQMSDVTDGWACVLIQENAGSGQDDGYAARILKQATLRASIHMPADLFRGKSSVQTAIYLFQTGRPHKEKDLVKFIDFSVDGYTRSNRRKSTQAVNLRDTDHAQERYEEVVARVLEEKPATEHYTKENGRFIKDTIGLKGGDWTFNQHKKIDTTPTETDFKKTVADYLAWKVGAILKGEVSADV